MEDRRQQLDRIARTAIQAQTEASLDSWLTMLTEDIRYETIGMSQASGVFEGKAALRDLEGFVAEVIDDDGIGITIDEVFVDDPTIVVLARGESVTRVTRIPYNNTYCQVLTMRGDLIEQWIEYLDTALVERVLDAELDAQDRMGRPGG